MIINLPFAGFYESMYSDGINHAEEQYIEWLVEEEGLSEEIKDKIANNLYKFQDNNIATNHVAKEYVDYLDSGFSYDYDLNLELTFSDMSSPREYNFTTDRIFAHISEANAKKLFDLVMKTPGLLEKTIKKLFTSYSGFISHYSNDIDEWLERPVTEWDHNELGTLLHALLPREFEDSIGMSIAESNVFDEAFHASMDWDKFEQALKEWKLVEDGECEDDGKQFPLGVDDPKAYVAQYETLNHLKGVLI